MDICEFILIIPIIYYVLISYLDEKKMKVKNDLIIDIIIVMRNDS